MKTLKSATLDGFEALSVEVEATFSKALPVFSIVGLGNASIQESKDRVKSALLTNDFKFPPLKITVNLSPSENYKSGSHFDLPIALLIALQSENIDFGDFYCFGELGLDGKLKDTDSIFVLALSLVKNQKIKKILVPFDSVAKISTLPNLEIYAVSTLIQAIEMFKNSNFSQYKIEDPKEISSDFLFINGIKYFINKNFDLDFAQIKGQVVAKRAALISAAGNHNMLLEGSPGCGKSMIAKRLPFIMPPMSLDEVLERAKLEALEAKEPKFLPIRILRSPHHSSTRASIFGGGVSLAKIGEIAISSNGILFFDELPHFAKNILEAMREPLEDYKILISRVNSKIEYKTKFLFLAAMNPCPCGNLLSSNKECRCTDLEIKRYKNKLSEPFLDRIDLHIQMAQMNEDDKSTISSSEMQKLVFDAFKMQKARGQVDQNGKLKDEEIEQYCILSGDLKTLLDKAAQNFSLSHRGINKIIKVARTIADLDSASDIQKIHLLEAMSYRKR